MLIGMGTAARGRDQCTAFWAVLGRKCAVTLVYLGVSSRAVQKTLVLSPGNPLKQLTTEDTKDHEGRLIFFFGSLIRCGFAQHSRVDRKALRRERKLSLSPMEFIAQDVEEGLTVSGAHEFYSTFRLFAFHPVAGLHRHSHLTIGCQERLFVADCDRHHDL